MKYFIFIMLIVLTGCNAIEEQQPMGTVTLTGLEVQAFSQPTINARINSLSEWKHVYQNRITISFRNSDSGEETVLEIDPNDFGQAYQLQLPQGEYSFSSIGEGELMEDFLPFQINGTFVLGSGPQELELQGFTKYALITVGAELVENVRMTVHGESKDLPLNSNQQIYYQYIRSSEPVTIEVRGKDSQNIYSDKLSVEERHHYHFVLGYNEVGNANVVELLMREFDFDYYFGTVEVPFNSIIRDIDGNVYKVVKIGSQIWMAENLRTSRFCNGDEIRMQTEKPRFSPEDHEGPAYFHINYNPEFDDPYGKLYNKQVILDQREICPCDWSVPTQSDFEQLRDFLGGPVEASNKMRNPSPLHWIPPTNKGATNESGFNALGTGLFIQEFLNELYYGNFFLVNEGASFWTSTRVEQLYDWAKDPLVYLIMGNDETIFLGNEGTAFYFKDYFRFGDDQLEETYAYQSIRCIKK